MDALRASYGGSSSDEEADTVSPSSASTSASTPQLSDETVSFLPLPPPSPSLLHFPNSTSILDDLPIDQATRVRSFPHVQGNYALHLYIPVYVPTNGRKEVALFLKKVSSLVPALHLVDIDVPLDVLCKDDHKLEQALAREFHVSLSRTVPIRVHQIDSIVTMLRQKLQSQRRYWIDFSKWETFVNDDLSRTFLSMEIITGGLMEIRKQIQIVNEVYKLHNLPEFYKEARPHISLAWAIGDLSKLLSQAVHNEMKSSAVMQTLKRCIFTTKFKGIECKIGKKIYKICKFPDE
ncbi:U6 snRNA phosphodiesterase isoform X1 [Benincasa hispida]|uniref:U6 snRNA phosphodiesterase isoform X1 n=2 Tax=Benincasa hispida TaxID=102211 RepID=UPI00190188A0|nr:U6 snRNA phosphodiesterase isoform X1 [Benincasa hispida]